MGTVRLFAATFPHGFSPLIIPLFQQAEKEETTVPKERYFFFGTVDEEAVPWKKKTA